MNLTRGRRPVRNGFSALASSKVQNLRTPLEQRWALSKVVIGDAGGQDQRCSPPTRLCRYGETAFA